MKKISVIVPIYNAEKHLKECIDSIINQTYRNLEIILVNDGSNDGSKKICKKYAAHDSRVIVVNKKNGGVSSSRNEGIKKATGHFILFVDSDDILAERYVELLVNHQKDNKTLICCLFKRFINNTSNNTDYTGRVIEVSQNEIIKIYNYEILNTPCCKLYFKSIIDKYNIRFDQCISLGEDLLFNLEYYKHVNKYLVITDHLYNYRIGNNTSLSGGYLPDISEVQYKLINTLENVFNSEEQKHMVDDFSAHYLIYSLDNEFRNPSNSFIVRYKEVRKILVSERFKNALKSHRNGMGMVEYFLLKHNKYLLFKVYQRIQQFMNQIVNS